LPRGKFITFEGGEGTGKSTQVKRLAESLRADGHNVVTTREPGGAPGAEDIRKLLVEGEPGRWDPLTEAILHFAARREHLARTVLPALERGDWVISDRFADSTMAYQAYGQGVPAEKIDALYRDVIGDLRPDLTIILDLPPEQGLHRASARAAGTTRYEQMDVAFHRKIRDAFLEIARRDPGRCVVIATGAPPDQVAAQVLATVRARLSLIAKAP
jgi:dTMP kinase